jgi:hypothetical protein
VRDRLIDVRPAPASVRSPLSAVDLRAQLKRQLDFISRSCDSFDRGYADEGIRIAVALRILLHDTGRSTSLLTLLGAKVVPLLSTVSEIFARAVFADSTGFLKIDSHGKSSLVPKLDQARLNYFVPRNVWWNQLVYVRGEIRIRRRDIILTAADKDGGAHVDPVLTREELRSGGWSAIDADGQETRIEQQQFIFLRQAGYEILNSPRLIALAG